MNDGSVIIQQQLGLIAACVILDADVCVCPLVPLMAFYVGYTIDEYYDVCFPHECIN